MIGFNVKPDAKAQELAEQNKVDVILSNIIYEITDKITKTAKDMRTPIFEERVIGHCEAIRIFKISRIGTVAGCSVKEKSQRTQKLDFCEMVKSWLKQQ